MSLRAPYRRALLGFGLGAGLGLSLVVAQVGPAVWRGARPIPCSLPDHPLLERLHAPIEVGLLLVVPFLAAVGQWLAVVAGATRDARGAPPTRGGAPGLGPLRVALCAIHAQALAALLLGAGLGLLDLAGLFRTLEGRLPGVDAARWGPAAAGAALLLAFALLMGPGSLLPRPRRLSPLQVVLASVSTTGGAAFWSIAALVYLGVIR